LDLFNGAWVIGMFQIICGTALVIIGIAYIFRTVASAKKYSKKEQFARHISHGWNIFTGIFMILCGCLLIRGLYWQDDEYTDIAKTILRLAVASWFIVLIGRFILWKLGYDTYWVVVFLIIYVMHVYFLCVVESYEPLPTSCI